MLMVITTFLWQSALKEINIEMYSYNVSLMKTAIIEYLKQASLENFRNVMVILISNNRLWHCLRPTCTRWGYSQFIHQWDIPRRNSMYTSKSSQPARLFEYFVRNIRFRHRLLFSSWTISSESSNQKKCY